MNKSNKQNETMVKNKKRIICSMPEMTQKPLQLGQKSQLNQGFVYYYPYIKAIYTA